LFARNRQEARVFVYPRPARHPSQVESEAGIIAPFEFSSMMGGESALCVPQRFSAKVAFARWLLKKKREGLLLD
jgi:hypothetical protein